MFQKLEPTPPDPILGLNQIFLKDPNPEKINLSIGVYQDADGNTPIFSAVKKAEKTLLKKQQTKTYIPQAGDAKFLEGSVKLLLGDRLANDLDGYVSAVMTPGGCGALRMLAELLLVSSPKASVWVSNPTWPNHYPLLQSAGLNLKEYAYYDMSINGIDFLKMMESLEQIPEGDVVLLHGCCHNPTGADLSHDQWDKVIDLLQRKKLLPFIDVAYQGFGDGLEKDAYGVRRAVKLLPEVIIASSCSKNFGLYRERTGCAMVVSKEKGVAQTAATHVMSAARRNYSMSPYHGGGIAGRVLSKTKYREEWIDELEQIRKRMNRLRTGLADGLNQAQSRIDFEFVANSRGMFCYLGIPEQAVLDLRSEYGIYLLNSTRVNIAGLSEQNLPLIIDRVSTVLNK